MAAIWRLSIALCLVGSGADDSCAAGDSSDSCSPKKESGKAKVRKCSLDWANELVPPRSLTAAKAAKVCKSLSGCSAATAEVGEAFSSQAEYVFHFVGRTSPCTPDDAFRTVILSGSADGRKLVWEGPPKPEHWLLHPGASLIQEHPPVVQFENFLSDAEVEHVKKMAEPRFAPSSVGMTYQKGGARTSLTAWLNAQTDYQDSILSAISDRITSLTSVVHTNMEPFQVVKYAEGQRFSGHQDFLDEQVFQSCGGRVGTFFMYLNDVPEGGETEFRAWNFTVKPKKGLAVLWWNVNYTSLAEGKFDIKDASAWHEALPVTKGEKWVVNKWLHPTDFLTPYHAGKLR